MRNAAVIFRAPLGDSSRFHVNRERNRYALRLSRIRAPFRLLSLSAVSFFQFRQTDETEIYALGFDVDPR